MGSLRPSKGTRRQRSGNTFTARRRRMGNESWLADLFPYIKDPYIATPTVRNPVLNVRREQLTSTSGLSPTSVPTGLSRAPFIVKWASGQQEMELIAGFIGVKQDVKTGQIEPEI